MSTPTRSKTLKPTPLFEDKRYIVLCSECSQPLGMAYENGELVSEAEDDLANTALLDTLRFFGWIGYFLSDRPCLKCRVARGGR